MPKLSAAPAVPAVIPRAPELTAAAIALTPPADINNGVRVGLLLPLSGPRRAVGRALLDAAMLAMFDIADSDFVLVPVDTKSTPEGAAMAAVEVLAAEVKLVIGPVFSDAVQIAAAPIQKAGLSMLVFSNDRAVAKAGVYLSGLLPETQVDRIVRYAAKRGLEKIAAIVPQGPFGARVSDALHEAAADLGMELTRIREYDPTPEKIAKAVRVISNYDYRRAALLEQRAELKRREDEGSRRALARLEILETIGAVPFDALLVAASGEDLVNVAAQLGNYDIDSKRTRILGTSDWAAENTGREPSLVGAWFATPPIDATRDFATRFGRIYGTAPPTIASSAYDLVSLAAILGAREGGARFDRETLTSKTGFTGVGGLFRFLNSGLVERSLEVRTVQAHGNRVIDPARERFENAGN
ncbi:MAG: penicillin-binding protein activator [Pseudomonadota bacterium]|nr:penicillin-binding protein activator [Pseudomonadota bacterium]